MACGFRAISESIIFTEYGSMSLMKPKSFSAAPMHAEAEGRTTERKAAADNTAAENFFIIFMLNLDFCITLMSNAFS